MTLHVMETNIHGYLMRRTDLHILSDQAFDRSRRVRGHYQCSIAGHAWSSQTNSTVTPKRSNNEFVELTARAAN